MINLSLKQIAAVLRGDVSVGQVVCPGPGHSRRDRSLTIKLDANAPDGFVVFSHSGDDFATCRDFVRERLGLPRGVTKREAPVSRQAPVLKTEYIDRTRAALDIWRESIDPRGTLAETYFVSRALRLDDDIAGSVVRWNPRLSAMIALFRNIETGKAQAVSRTYLNPDGSKRERKFLGPVGGGAIMLDAFDTVTHGLHIGEGVETCMSARQLGLRPTWALGSSGSIAAFPVLSGVECLTILAENDDASTRAVNACGTRWHDAGRAVLINRPLRHKDLNDCLKRGAI